MATRVTTGAIIPERHASSTSSSILGAMMTVEPRVTGESSVDLRC